MCSTAIRVSAPSRDSGPETGVIMQHGTSSLYADEPAKASPLLLDTGFSLQATYFPLGYAVEVASNSEQVLAAAEQSWGELQPRFEDAPLRLRIGVNEPDDNVNRMPIAPTCRLQWNLLSNIADAHNFVVSDLKEGSSFGWVTPTTVGSSLYFRYHMLEAAALSMIAARRAAPLHAACVSLGGHGILLCGDSGAGKSSLAYACARAGWTFTSDDASYLPLNREDRMVVGDSRQFRFRPAGAELFPEIAGHPVTPRAAGKPSVEIPTAEFPTIVRSNIAKIDSVVFLNRRAGKNSGLIPLSAESVLPWFTQYLIPSVDTYAAQLSALSRLFAVQAYELRYRDLDWGIEQVALLASGSW